MGKTRAEIQRAYRERKKLNDGDFLEKERLRQVKYRVPVAMLSRSKLKRRRLIDKEYSSKYRQKKKQYKELNERHPVQVEAVEALTSNDTLNSSATQLDEVSSSSDPQPSTSSQTRSQMNRLLVQLPFPTKCKASTRRSKSLAKSRHEVLRLKSLLKKNQQKSWRFQKRFERLKKTRKIEAASRRTLELTPKSKAINDIRKSGISPRSVPRSVVRQLKIGNAVISEIKNAHDENTNQRHRSSINTVVSGRIVKKYRCIRYLTKVTGITRHEFNASGNRKTLNVTKRKRLSKLKLDLETKVTEFLAKDEISRAMPGKRDFKKCNGERKQTRILNDYLSIIHERFRAENPETSISFSAFCKMRPKHIEVTSLLSRNKCLFTKHQNMALKLKCLTSTLGIGISPNPEVVGRNVSEEQMKVLLSSVQDDIEIEYEEWKSVDIQGKKKMRIVKICKPTEEFIKMMLEHFKLFLEHIDRVAKQYQSLHDLKENLPEEHIIVQMDFAENFLCQSNDEIQSAYWNATAATIHPVVIYHKSEGGVEHTKCKVKFQWPSKPDEIWIPLDDIIASISNPLPVGRSERYYTLTSKEFDYVNQMFTDK